jgi:hypothetical protein
MRRVIGFLEERLRRLVSSLDSRERGQALIIVVFGVFALLILVGLAVDLGLYYVERVRITRAVDAAALAAAYELPLENSARFQALDYLRQNGYDVDAPDTALVQDGTTISPPASGITRTTIWLNTAAYQQMDAGGAPIPNSAFRLEVQVRQAVPVIFLRFAGFRNIACQAHAVAENVNSLDVAIVFDKSGSMEFDTLCYGCWDSSDDDYPGGDLSPLVWDGAANGTPEHCGPTQRYQYSGEDYYFIEAEEYSYASNTYARDLYAIGYTYWALQRRPSSASSRGRDIVNRGAYIMHMPYPDIETTDGGGGMTCRHEELVADVDPADGAPDFNCWSGAPGGPYPAPRVDYNFTPLQNDSYYIWVRGQSAGSWTRSDGLDRRLFWGINGQLGWGTHTGCGGLLGCETDFTRGTGYNGANNNWQWRRLNDSAISLVGGTQYTLNFWAGGAEFAFDRIAITTNSGGSDGSPPSPINANSGRGVEEWANGRGGWACDPCDPRFAGYPADDPDRPGGFDASNWVGIHPVCDSGPNPDQREDDLYDDEQPMRASVEAAKMFVTELLDPRNDQVGYVRYSSSSQIASELQCLRRLGADACTGDVIDSTVVAALDATRADGSTNIAGGMLDGLQVLSTRSPHYGRPGAIHVMIVMTDGRANVSPNSACYSDPNRQWLDGAGTDAQDCVIYYAYEARDNNVIVYTITLGVSADFELMQAVADMTGGVHRNADRPEKLPAIFQELYELIFLRLVE